MTVYVTAFNILRVVYVIISFKHMIVYVIISLKYMIVYVIISFKYVIVYVTAFNILRLILTIQICLLLCPAH